jgi:outer membrane protein assembly factor BamE (lipoprotein component of BamABCDE complex)
MTRTRVGRTPGILAQNVTLLTFDDRGVLREVKRLNEDDSRPVDVVTRATPSPGSEASFMQQLLGNVGKFNAGGLSSSTDTAPGGGVGSSRGSGSTSR